MKYLGEGRIQDSRGKIWFFSHIKETVANFWGEKQPIKGSTENILVAVSEKWATDINSVEVQARFREWESIEIPFKEIIVNTEPFKRIVDIRF